MTDEQERLARFEAMLADVLAEQEEVARSLEDLRAQGKVKTATYHQLTARKLTLQTLVGLYERHGLLP